MIRYAFLTVIFNSAYTIHRTLSQQMSTPQSGIYYTSLGILNCVKIEIKYHAFNKTKAPSNNGSYGRQADDQGATLKTVLQILNGCT